MDRRRQRLEVPWNYRKSEGKARTDGYEEALRERERKKEAEEQAKAEANARMLEEFKARHYAARARHAAANEADKVEGLGIQLDYLRTKLVEPKTTPKVGVEPNINPNIHEEHQQNINGNIQDEPVEHTIDWDALESISQVERLNLFGFDNRRRQLGLPQDGRRISKWVDSTTPQFKNIQVKEVKDSLVDMTKLKKKFKIPLFPRQRQVVETPANPANNLEHKVKLCHSDCNTCSYTWDFPIGTFDQLHHGDYSDFHGNLVKAIQQCVVSDSMRDAS